MIRPRRTPRRDAAFMARAEHARLWALVEGAVVDALVSHPEYLTDAGRASAVRSITKRVVGQIVGRAKELREEGGLGPCRPAVIATDAGHPTACQMGGGDGGPAVAGPTEGGGRVGPPPMQGEA